MKKTKFSIFIVVILGLLLVAALVIGSRQNCQDFSLPDSRGETTDTNLPDYLSQVWPHSDSRISFLCYLKSTRADYSLGRGVGAGLVVANIDRLIWDRKNTEVTPLSKRVILIIDGKEMPSTSFTSIDHGLEIVKIDKGGNIIRSGRSTGYDFSWAPILYPGDHTAKLIITRDNGENVEYSWSFTITLIDSLR